MNGSWKNIFNSKPKNAQPMKWTDAIRYIAGIFIALAGTANIAMGEAIYVIEGIISFAFGASLLPFLYRKISPDKRKKFEIRVPLILCAIMLVYLYGAPVWFGYVQV